MTTVCVLMITGLSLSPAETAGGPALSLTTGSVELATGKSLKLDYTLENVEKGRKTEIAWESSDPEIVTVKQGKITGKNAGTAVVTCIARVKDGPELRDTCEVNVFIPVQKISFGEKSLSLYAGYVSQLQCDVSPADAKYQTVTWTSSDESVVTVNENGEAAAVAPGKATVTAVSAEPGDKPKTAKISVTVSESMIRAFISGETFQLTNGSRFGDSRRTVMANEADKPRNTKIYEITYQKKLGGFSTDVTYGFDREDTLNDILITANVKNGKDAVKVFNELYRTAELEFGQPLDLDARSTDIVPGHDVFSAYFLVDSLESKGVHYKKTDLFSKYEWRAERDDGIVTINLCGVAVKGKGTIVNVAMSFTFYPYDRTDQPTSAEISRNAADEECEKLARYLSDAPCDGSGSAYRYFRGYLEYAAGRPANPRNDGPCRSRRSGTICGSSSPLRRPR